MVVVVEYDVMFYVAIFAIHNTHADLGNKT
jgi:hypothetical protein